MRRIPVRGKVRNTEEALFESADYKYLLPAHTITHISYASSDKMDQNIHNVVF